MKLKFNNFLLFAGVFRKAKPVSKILYSFETTLQLDNNKYYNNIIYVYALKIERSWSNQTIKLLQLHFKSYVTSYIHFLKTLFWVSYRVIDTFIYFEYTLKSITVQHVVSSYSLL